jgi:hypothetical protein
MSRALARTLMFTLRACIAPNGTLFATDKLRDHGKTQKRWALTGCEGSLADALVQAICIDADSVEEARV